MRKSATLYRTPRGASSNSRITVATVWPSFFPHSKSMRNRLRRIGHVDPIAMPRIFTQVELFFLSSPNVRTG